MCVQFDEQKHPGAWLHIAHRNRSMLFSQNVEVPNKLQPATSNQDAKKWMDQGECLNQLNFSFGMKSDVRQCPETWCTTFLLELQIKKEVLAFESDLLREKMKENEIKK